MAPQRPCSFFQLGKCKQGQSCGFAHVQDPNFKRKACTHYALGRCTHGGKCTFSHAEDDISLWRATNNYQVVTTARNGTAWRDNSEDEFRRWRAKLPAPGVARDTLPSGFFQLGLKLVQGPTAVMQQTINLLAGEGGAKRVDQLVQLSRMSSMRVLFDRHVLPFFEMITHEAVTGSLLLSSRIMTIYNVMYHNNDRAVHLFMEVAIHLEEQHSDARPTSMKPLESTVAVFRGMVEACVGARANPGLVPVVELLDQIVQECKLRADTFTMVKISACMQHIKQRFNLPIAQFMPGTSKDAAAQATFELDIDGPGEKALHGPRHDNDFADIHDISILPTTGEILASRDEYWPRADQHSWHIPGFHGLLDRHFRLLREDTIGQLRDVIKIELEASGYAIGISPQANNGPRRFVYRDVAITDIECDANRGIQVCLTFEQPKEVVGSTIAEREVWWKASRRLDADALICLIDTVGSAVFFTVAAEREGKARTPILGISSRRPLQQQYSRAQNRASIVVRPVRDADVEWILAQTFAQTQDEPNTIVEFPGVLLPAFMPTLQALQSMLNVLDQPFSPLLTGTGPVNIDRPQYSTRPGFQFDFSSILSLDDGLFLTPAEMEREDAANLLTEASTLDSGQAKAVLASLVSSFALIQGPPGTGKSYTGLQILKVLLSHIKECDLGPIICVCYTNHALDQVLEALLDQGTTQIVRVGSRSQSARLQEVTLKAVTDRLDMTKVERQESARLYSLRAKECEEINKILHLLLRGIGDEEIEAHLQENHPERHHELFVETDEEGFTIVDYHPDRKLQDWIHAGHRAMTKRDQGLLELISLHQMSRGERLSMYETWKLEISNAARSRLMHSLKAYNEADQELSLIRSEMSLRVLKQAKIIGITTSGLARNLEVLRRVNSKILLCEEAGEVLESHLLTALLPNLEHAILIGDHQQLRPHIQNYALSTESKSGAKYRLDSSLFERLIHPWDETASALPYATLAVQRRMHPSISQLVRATQYPHLQDAERVRHYSDVVGMRKRLFWLDHENEEDGADSTQTTSRTNHFEVNMVAALVRHLVRQGAYRSGDIAVITPYLGQLRRIRRCLQETMEIVINERDAEDLEKDGLDEDDTAQTHEPYARGSLLGALRVATVDNFQGEEAKVIILSLVRCNKARKPGFLRTPNRINVAISRAQHGMYILGNTDTTRGVDMWSQVIDMLDDGDNLGEHFPLCCPRHPEIDINVKTPEDFSRLSPGGGCQLICDKQLTCGHACISQCHSDMLHETVVCLKPCNRLKIGCSHTCPLPCGQPCEKRCTVPVDGVSVKPPRCSHIKTSLPCYQRQDPSKIICNTLVNKRIPGCDHTVLVPCHRDVEGVEYKCSAICGSPLECGHICTKLCSECRTRDETSLQITRVWHGECMKPCGRSFTACRHTCDIPCHGDEPCPLCQLPCQTRCFHAACKKKCHEPCTPCAEEICGSRCQHSTCDLPCAAPCNWLPCGLRCMEKLSCGCQCPSLCGETCPDSRFCQKCSDEDVKAQQADMIMFAQYQDIDLNEDPCIFLPCGHIFATSTLDGVLAFESYYERDSEGMVKRIRNSSRDEPFSDQGRMKQCPTCRGSLSTVNRYSRISRRALLDESVKRLTTWANLEHYHFAEKLRTVHEHTASRKTSSKAEHQSAIEGMILGGPLDDQLKLITSAQNVKRYPSLLKLRWKIHKFCEAVSVEQRPYARVRESIEATSRRRTTALKSPLPTPTQEVQPRENIQANILLVRCDTALIGDFVTTCERVATGKITVRLDLNRQQCSNLALEAHWNRHVRQEVEANILWAQLAAIECSTLVTDELLDRCETLSTQAHEHIKQAESVCRTVSDAFNQRAAQYETHIDDPMEGLTDEIAEVKRMLNERTSDSEMRIIVRAMQKEFSGTGHWYRCRNGHPFTIGECGMPMQLASCPACGEAIGGTSHRAVGGVQSGEDIERRFGGLQID